MKNLKLKLLRAVKTLKLARCQQATKTETLDQNPICLLANREVNLNIFIVQNKQLNAILEKDTNICFTKTDNYDEPGEEESDNGAAARS